jgi:preprotein translocase subunit SecG
MELFLTILIVLACVLVVLLVLVQNSKGGGLAAGFTSGNQVMGAPKTADFLEKATWTLVAVIILLSIFAVGFHKNAGVGEGESQISEQVQEAASEMQQQAATPAFDETEAAEAAE